MGNYFAQVSQGKKARGSKKKCNGLGFVQVAKIKELSMDEINNIINDEPNNNIVEITEVDNNSMQVTSDEDTEMIVESPTNTMYKRFHKLTPYKMLVGQFSDEEIGIMGCVYNYIMREEVRNFGDEMWIHNCYNSST